MSYCRWSCMGGQCDLYAYENTYGGVTIHVATSRRVLTDDVPPDPMGDYLSGKISPEEFVKKYKARDVALDKCELRAIGLPFDGENYHLSHADAARAIANLRAAGYKIPDGVENAVLEDAGMEQNGTET